MLLPSAIARSAAPMSRRLGCRCEDLEPRMLMMDERIIAKLRRQRRRPMIELYGVGLGIPGRSVFLDGLTSRILRDGSIP